MAGLLLPLALLFAADAAVETVPIAERQLLVLLVQSPERAAASLPDLVSIAAPIFALHTAFDVVAPWHAGVAPEALDSCASSTIGCWYRQVARSRRAANVLLLGFFPGAPGSREVRVETLYFDSKTAPDVENVRSDEELERLLLETAPVVERKSLMRNDRIAINQYFVDLVKTGINSTLKNNDRLQNLGDIVLHVPTLELSIELDGKTRTAHGPLVRLKGVEPGQRSLVVRETGEARPLYQGGIEVRAGADALIEVGTPKSSMESALFWSGSGVAALGAIVTVLALTKTIEPKIIGCDAQYCEKPNPQFASFCGRGDDCSFVGATRIAPLGYSLIITGAIWMLGELLTSRELTWLPLVAGIAGGTAAYGVSVAVD